MAISPGPKDVDLTLTVFGSLCTENAACDLPEGTSPDNQDVVYFPGVVAMRPGLKRVFSTPFGTVSVVYAKSFVMPNGGIENLYLDSGGSLWWEDFSNSPGSYTLIGSATPMNGLHAKSTTAFGREYIAISDGLHGADPPLQWDGTYLDRVTQDGPGAPPTVASVAKSPVTITGLVRSGNIVTATTSTGHGCQVGYQVQITGVDSSFVGTSGGVTHLSKLVIANESLPGIATITTLANHGLKPQTYISLSEIYAAGVNDSGGSLLVWNSSRQGGIVTLSTTQPHGLSVGSSVTVQGFGDNSFNCSAMITAVPTPLSVVYYQSDVDATSSGGTMLLNWPLPATETPSYFEVLSCPTPDTFQIAINYSNGTWTTGYVKFAWTGMFFVKSVPTSNSLTYQQFGPDDTATLTADATLTPNGQAAPGIHQCQVMFLTRQGYVTRPSPPVEFVANGGQYIQVSGIPIGPSNVIARILAFTGVDGAYYFYIPVPALINGQQVSTATQINDNSTTTVTLDFSDNTLFAATAINIPGNDTPSQIVLDGALGFGFYGSRLVTWGQRNRIQNLLNMGFEGGALPAAATQPAGWTSSGGGALAAGHFGEGYNFTGGTLSQPMYLDAYGAPIAQPNTWYRFRCWASGAGTITATIAGTGFSATASVSGGGWKEARFSLATPLNIPSDLTLTISGSALVDEMSIIYDQNPYSDGILYASYVNNPEGFDGVSGKFGASQDTRKVMDIGAIRNTLYLLTRDPGGRLHQTSDNGVTEPSGWQIGQVASNCGVLSAFALTKSQADDSSASGGEEWLAWASSSGARIFSGEFPAKISQEIQPDWQAINQAAATSIWTLNDPVERVIYFGLPVGTKTAPSLVYPVNYKELDTASQIATQAPIHTSLSGRLIATDHSRKWTRWNMTMNGAALMYRTGLDSLTPVFFGGNGSTPGTADCFGNVYTLSTCNLSDDDYGAFVPYYVTYFFVNGDAELASGLRGYRKMVVYYAMFVSGSGYVTVTPLIDGVYNPWALTCKRALSQYPTFDLEWGGGSASGQRIAFKIQWSAS